MAKQRTKSARADSCPCRIFRFRFVRFDPNQITKMVRVNPSNLESVAPFADIVVSYPRPL
jgi:hypothetical protein